MPRQKQVSFSGLEPKIDEVFKQYEYSRLAIEQYFSLDNPKAEQLFAFWTFDELQQKREQVLQENERALSLVLLSAIEASFRIDYSVRIAKKSKDKLSRHFKAIFITKGNRISLEDEILDAWKEVDSINKTLIGDIKSALKYRHWLAHGRYWLPKFGQNYDFIDLQILAEKILDNFDFKTE